jgi:hypothetical protein
MEIKTPAQLKKATHTAGELLQAIHRYCEDNGLLRSPITEARVRFGACRRPLNWSVKAARPLQLQQ